MSSISAESDGRDSVIVLFPKTDNFKFCVPANSKEKPNIEDGTNRIDKLSMPTIRHLIASGIYAMKTQNKRRINNLEKLLCARLNETGEYEGIPAKEYQANIEKFIAKNKPTTPIDRYKFSKDDLDHPIFYETYETRPGNITQTKKIYNFRGIPKRIPSCVLKYKATKRIIELAKPRKPKCTSKRLSFIHKASTRKTPTRTVSDSIILLNAKGKKPVSKKLNKRKTATPNLEDEIPGKIRSDSKSKSSTSIKNN